MSLNHGLGGKSIKKTIIIYYSQTGQSKKIAEMLGEKIDADLYEIQTVRTYNSDMWKADEEAKQELKTGKLPELKGQLPDIRIYETILIGGPVWGQTISNPVLSFIRKMDFSGKNVSSFWTFYDHDEKYSDEIKKEAKGANVVEGLKLPRAITNSTTKLENALAEWSRAFL
ncbi:MAG: flavodoxin [Anaerostipes sp.]|nr:flavodoxin [Anaerostipes sp.]